MSRNNLITLLLIIASLLLAFALFIAGAIWRGRTTRSAVGERGFVLQGTTEPS
jgi:predicted permease